jgi:hypothetical protein
MSRGPARLDLESASNENDGHNGVMVTNEELEESKTGIRMMQRQSNNLRINHRSDAFQTEANR